MDRNFPQHTTMSGLPRLDFTSSSAGDEYRRGCLMGFELKVMPCPTIKGGMQTREKDQDEQWSGDWGGSGPNVVVCWESSDLSQRARFLSDERTAVARRKPEPWVLIKNSLTSHCDPHFSPPTPRCQRCTCDRFLRRTANHLGYPQAL